jgi:nucleoside-triphosphatase THEP1
MNNYLIQGKRDTGKTHLIKRVITYLNDKSKMAGFFTQKLASGDVILKAWDNFSLADSGPQMLIYNDQDNFIRKNVFEELGVWAIKRAIKLSSFIIMDELGSFEKHCQQFINAVHEALNSSTPVLATLKDDSNLFLDTVVARGDITLFVINQWNRDELYGKLSMELDNIYE